MRICASLNRFAADLTPPPSSFVEEADLHAFVDGLLDPQQRRQVEEHLLTHPEDAALVENWRRKNAALRAVYEPIARETPAPSLRSAAAQVTSQPQGPAIETGATHWGRPGVLPRMRRREDVLAQQRRQAIFASVLAVLAVAAVAALATFIFASRHESSPSQSVMSVPQGYVSRAGLTYATYISDVHAVEIDASRHDELMSWLKSRVGFAKLPDLSAHGLRLLGGRVAPGVAAPAGFLVYERADGGRVGLYFERATASVSQQNAKVGIGIAAIEWRAADFAFVLIGPLSVDEMQSVAESAAARVNLPAPGQ